MTKYNFKRQSLYKLTSESILSTIKDKQFKIVMRLSNCSTSPIKRVNNVIARSRYETNPSESKSHSSTRTLEIKNNNKKKPNNIIYIYIYKGYNSLD